jgi:hypothetical protein
MSCEFYAAPTHWYGYITQLDGERCGGIVRTERDAEV